MIAQRPPVKSQPRTSPVALAWASAKLRRLGEPVTPENLARILAEQGRKRETPESALPVVEPKEAEAVSEQPLDSQIQNLRAELEKHRVALRESQRQELAMRGTIDALSRKLRSADSIEHELSTLNQELERSKQLIQELSNRVEESHVEELLQEAERSHSLEQRRLLQEAEAREQQHLARIAELQAAMAERLSSPVGDGATSQTQELLRLRQELADWKSKAEALQAQWQAALEKNAALEKTVAQLTEQIKSLAAPGERHAEQGVQISALEKSLADLRAENAALSERLRLSQEVVARTDEPAAQEELQKLRQLVQRLSGLARIPETKHRKILLETLEQELARCLHRKSELLQRHRDISDASTASAGQPDLQTEKGRLAVSLDYLQARIEAFEVLIAESIAFLRQTEEAVAAS